MERQYTILVVEDEQPILNGVQRALSAGLDRVGNVYMATDGEQALKVLETEHPDLMITDLRMPKLDGIELVRQMRESGYTQPVLVLTALEDFAAAKTLISYQIENYILKPFTLEDILHETDKILHKLDQRQALRLAQRLLEEKPEMLEEINIAVLPPVVRKTIDYIEAHLAEDISLALLATELFVNKSYLSALFKKETGTNINEYIKQKRLRAAKAMLLKTEMRISEIGEKTGFGSDKYFIQVFKESEGLTPLAYRKSIRNNK